MNNSDFFMYTTDYISGVMSLRKPQEDSLRLLEKIINNITLNKNMDLKSALKTVNSISPTCTDFERDFMSLTFALATGVGKTRLMGAFIAYLYTQHNIKNFFVVAPGTTVYDKLRKDLSDKSNPKYVFKGLGCFREAPKVISGDEYRDRQISLNNSEVNIFVFNIDKFNKEDSKMKQINENLGDSFYKLLAELPDLVLIMDESHHYRAQQGAKALNELKPLLGLELTATPLATVKNKQIPFENVVFEYPLSKAIEDGYTRTPFAVTRSDIDIYNFGEEQIDKMMLIDGIGCHERAKNHLKAYAQNYNKKLIKPFMLVVCNDTEHANNIEKYIKSDEFKDGAYRNKTITVHSKKSGAESDFNTKLLLEVENVDNPIEIVIHVNKLKEGWDVNNLYTIVPLRTASSKILREQMVGRGLRLPYGERTGDKEIDAVMLTAHDKFNDILKEAQKGDSIFKAGNIIKIEELEPEEIECTQISLNIDKSLDEDYKQTNIEKSDKNDKLLKGTKQLIEGGILKEINATENTSLSEKQIENIVEKTKKKLSENKDLADTYLGNELPLNKWIKEQVEKTYNTIKEKFIPIPKIKITDSGVDEYTFIDFDLDLEEFSHKPIENNILIQNLENMNDREQITGDRIDFEGYKPERIIIKLLREKPEIDYERCSKLLIKLISQACSKYNENFGENGMKNIVMMYKRDIANKIYSQMMKHFYYENGFLKEEVIGTRDYNLNQTYNFKKKIGLFESYSENIQSILFEDIKKGVFNIAKFDSEPELILARVLERDEEVKNWLRPAPNEFNITYNNGKKYEPDFVVETMDKIYLIEVKGENRLNEPDVIAKKKRAINYCEIATNWCVANGFKKWEHLFIPSKEIQANSSFNYLANRFKTIDKD